MGEIVFGEFALCELSLKSELCSTARQRKQFLIVYYLVTY